MTDESELRAETDRAIEDARVGKPALEVLRQLMAVNLGLCAFYQPRPAPLVNEHYDEQRFRYYAERAADLAKSIAGYEAPRLSAVATVPQQEARTLEFTLRVFDGGRKVKQVEHRGDEISVTRYDDGSPIIEGTASDAAGEAAGGDAGVAATS